MAARAALGVLLVVYAASMLASGIRESGTKAEAQTVDQKPAVVQPVVVPTAVQPEGASPKPVVRKVSSVASKPVVVSPTDQVVGLVNRERLARGLRPLKPDPVLMAAAQNWSSVQASKRRMYHSRMGYGENVAYGQTTPQHVHTTWMNSPGHRRNILNPSYSSIGVGVAYNGTPYWTQTFQ